MPTLLLGRLLLQRRRYNTSCGTNSSNGYLHCHSSGTGFSAKCEQASSPSSISPFEQIYGTGPTLANVERFAGLVYSPSIGTFCAVQAQDRSVECLLYCSSECSSKDHLGCPA
jgi:hypothetical protein